MGSHNSFEVTTPPFHSSEWQQLPDRNDIHEDYGIFRTLQHRNTGQKIDEYEFIWQDQQDFNYYLKSFNWRYQKPNVVTTRHMDIRNKSQFCSQSYAARVYIEHIFVRLSQVFDIPYPDNLFVLREALRGYGHIYRHSKFFFVEENQICVDEKGAVKVWINGDLSINYPNTLGQNIDIEGQEEMVDMVITLITENTDSQSEPSLKFIDYYQKKKGVRGKTFEQALKMVETYARLNKTQIPSRFQAVLDSGQPLELKSQTKTSQLFSQNSKSQLQTRNHQYLQEQPERQTFRPSQGPPPQPLNRPTSNFNENMSFGPNFIGEQYRVQGWRKDVRPQTFAVPASPQNIYYGHNQIQFQPTNHIVHSYYPPQIPKDLSYSNNPTPGFTFTSQLSPQPISNNRQRPPKVQIKLNNQYKNYGLPSQNQNCLQPKMRGVRDKVIEVDTRSLSKERKPSKKRLQLGSDSEQERDQVEMEMKPLQTQFQSFKINRSRNSEQSQKNQTAQSLPINPSLMKRKDKELSSMMNSNKSVQSHINSNQGISSLKLNQLSTRKYGPKSSRRDKQSLRYYSSFDDQIEMDPDIAGDIAKYLLS